MNVALTSSASVMMHPMTAHTRRVPSMSHLRMEDFSWSMGTNQAPMAGVAVLSRLSCLLIGRITSKKLYKPVGQFEDQSLM